MSTVMANGNVKPQINIMDFIVHTHVQEGGEGKVQHSTQAFAMTREEQERYLLSLLSFGLERVAAEPERLANESRANKKETESHAVENYGAFLQSAVCVRNVREELESSGRLLHELAARVPSLQSSCASVLEKARALDAERKDVLTTFKQHNQLLEILEVPQLLDTAVRNEYYEEALDIAAFARKLLSRHSDVGLLKELVASVEVCEGHLLQQLLQKLQSNIQLPVCLHVIGLLRRLGKHSDEQLRFTFLRCRDAWLQSVIDDALLHSSTGSYAHLCKYTDLMRVHLFEIATQYRAIFLDFNSVQEEEASADGGLLFAWAGNRLAHFIRVLAQGLPCLKEGNQISSVLEKAMYCGAYLGREGLDFRCAISALFEDKVLALVHSGMADARQAFEVSLSTQAIAPMPAALKQRYEEGSHGEQSPPSALLDFPPLAVLCNKVVEAFNELRECAIASTCTRAHETAEAALTTCCESLALHWVEQEGCKEMEERNALIATMKCMCTVLIPYLARCLQTVYGVSQVVLNIDNVVSVLQEQLRLEEEAAKQRKAEEQRRRREEEEARRKAEEVAAAARQKAEEEVAAARKKVEEEMAERKRKEMEAAEAQRRAQEDQEAQKLGYADADARRRAEAEKARREEEEREAAAVTAAAAEAAGATGGGD